MKSALLIIESGKRITMKNAEKIRKRCPDCNSSEIYKRIRSEDETTKKYICRECKYEFDSPFIGKRKISLREFREHKNKYK